MTNKNPDVDIFFQERKKWKEEMEMLREIVLECGLTEVLKWKQPCYTFDGANMIIIGAFKDFCTLSFFKGVLLKDKNKILEKAGENTRSARIVKFSNIERIKNIRSVLIDYITESIELEKEGKKVDFTTSRDETYPQELVEILEKDLIFKKSFESLTPGKKRGYILFFKTAKQSQTRINRIIKYREKIINGKGINDWK